MGLDAQDIDRIAERVVTRLAEAQGEPVAAPVRFVDARTVARLLSVEREWVYAHAEQLGAVRLGGEHGRLRFDLAALGQRLERVGSASPRAASTASQRGQGRAPRSAPLIPYAQQPPTGSEKVA